MAYAREQRGRGKRWRDIAGEVGLSATVLQRWARAARGEPRRLARVEVIADPKSAEAVSLVSPSGYRIEGLAVEAALRALAQLR
jgi:hypothetical protein